MFCGLFFQVTSFHREMEGQFRGKLQMKDKFVTVGRNHFLIQVIIDVYWNLPWAVCTVYVSLHMEKVEDKAKQFV